MRGTTPIHTFYLPFSAEDIAKAKVVYKVDDQILVKKNTSDCKMESNSISVTLTREETVKFPDNTIVKAQLEVETKAGESLKTDVYKLWSSELLDEEKLI